jgi:membrane protein
MKPFPVPENRLLRFPYLMVQRYLRHRVGIQSAALAFYLLFSIFPFLIFISALLGLLQLNVAGIMQALSEVLPREVVRLAGIYLNYVGSNSSLRLLLFGLLFSVYFPMRAANALMHSVRTAYHLGPPPNAVIHWLKTFLYTVLLIAAIALTLTLMTVGERFLLYAVEQFRLPVLIAELWVNLRFPVIIVVGYFALFFLYAMAQDHRPRWRDLWPGTLASLAGWVLLNWLYSFYVNHIAHYSALYGSIGTVIVLLVWLNLSATVLIMGAEMNGTLIGLRKDAAAL